MELQVLRRANGNGETNWEAVVKVQETVVPGLRCGLGGDLKGHHSPGPPMQ